MTDRIILMRHFKDQDNLLFQNNSSLEADELKKAEVVASEISEIAINTGFQEVHFITSDKIRAESTSAVVAQKIPILLNVTCEVDSRIREIDQGSYLLPKEYKPGDHFQVLQDAWSIFFTETFTEGNLYYNFGDPIKLEDCGYKYPEIAEHFDKYGESQLDFSIRFYSFLSDLCKKYHNDSGTLPIVVTHQALVARFFEMGYIINKIKNHDLPQPNLGSIPLLEWNTFQELKNTDNMFIDFGRFKSMSLSEVTDFTVSLDEEIDYLKLLKEKHE